MTLESWPHWITLAYVEHLALAIVTWTKQQVHAGLVQLGTLLDLGQQGTREDNRFTHPVGTFNQAQAIRIAIGNEDAKGEGFQKAHVM